MRWAPPVRRSMAAARRTLRNPIDVRFALPRLLLLLVCLSVCLLASVPLARARPRSHTPAGLRAAWPYSGACVAPVAERRRSGAQRRTQRRPCSHVSAECSHAQLVQATCKLFSHNRMVERRAGGYDQGALHTGHSSVSVGVEGGRSFRVLKRCAMHRRAARRTLRGSRATCIGGLCADVRSWLSAEGFAAFVRTNVRLWEEYDAHDATRRIPQSHAMQHAAYNMARGRCNAQR
jgi:hypothetical protein